MNEPMEKFYLTTPIYYPNARPHVGSAYTTIVCDVIARYKRMCGYDVAFLTGTDEHGEKLQRAAEAAGIPVEKFVAEKRELFKELWRKLGISEYKFVHTSQNEAHKASVQWMIRRAAKAGYIDKKKYEGRYCIHDERYVSDNAEPVDCDICGRPAELISEENYFFKLSAFGGSDGPLMRLYRDNPNFVLPDFRMNEVKSFVEGGLRDISISRRRLKWGIPWPDDPEEVVYVWYDALTSYLTGIGFRGEEQSEDFKKYWMGAEGPSEVVHMIGKDILRFHAVYWPAFLLAAGLPLPKTIFAHGWIYYEQDKMSKSKGNVVYPEPIVDALESFGAPGNDALRYYLLRDTPFGQDASFSYEGLIQRYNSDLANDLGNLASRTLTMIGGRSLGGKIPKSSGQLGDDAILGIDRSADIGEAAQRALANYRGRLAASDFSRGIEALWKFISVVNKYLVDTSPWAITITRILNPVTGNWEDADDPAASDRNTILYVVAEALRFIAVMAYPLVPTSAERLWKQLGCEGDIKDQKFDDLKWQSLKPGIKVGKPEPIFPRLDKAVTLAKLHEMAEADRNQAAPKKEKISVETPEKPASSEAVPAPTLPAPAAAPTAPAATPASDKISIDDFAKVEMRVGEVLSAEAVPNATKLLKLQVDIGTEVRQVCAGIAEYYQPEQLIGMKVVIVTNLQPRKLRGVESNGMVVAASAGDGGRPVLVTFKEDVPKGARLR